MYFYAKINVHADVSTVYCKLTTYDFHNFEFINSFTIKDDFAKYGFFFFCKNKPL